VGRLAAPWPHLLGRGGGVLRWPTSALLTATIARPPGRWPWTAFAASCSTAGYVFLYSVRHTAGCAFFAPDPRPVLSTRVCRVQVYYFFVKTKMSGFFQTVFYFGYSAPPPRASLCAPGPALMRCHSRARRCNCSVDFLRGPRRDVRNFGLLRLLRLRAPHLREYQVGLTVATRSPTTGGASCVVGLMT